MLSVEEFRKPLGPGYKAGQITCLDLRTGAFFGMGASPSLNINFSTHHLGWYTQGFNGRVDNCDVSEGVKRYVFINYQLLVRNSNTIKSSLPSVHSTEQSLFIYFVKEGFCLKLRVYVKITAASDPIKFFSNSKSRFCLCSCLQLCSFVDPFNVFPALFLYLYWKSTGQCPSILKLGTWTY